MTNPAVNEDVDSDTFHAWGKLAMREVWRYLASKGKKKIDGKDWNVGWHGSVWKDMTLVGVSTRICYYSRKNNPEQMSRLGEENKWVIMLDPQSIDTFQPHQVVRSEGEEALIEELGADVAELVNEILSGRIERQGPVNDPDGEDYDPLGAAINRVINEDQDDQDENDSEDE